MTREKWDEELPLGKWLEAVADPQPLPAGGRVGSLTAAFAAALIEKVGRIVLRSASRSALHAKAESVANRAITLRPQLLAVGEADDRAYAAVMAARRAATSGVPSIALRDAKLATALLQLELLQHAMELKGMAQALSAGTGPALGADLAIAAHLAQAVALGAMGNIAADLIGLDDADAMDVRQRAASLLARGAALPG